MNTFKRTISILLICVGIVFFAVGYYQTHSAWYSSRQISYYDWSNRYRNSDKSTSISGIYKNAMQQAQDEMRELEEKQKQDYMIGAFSVAVGLVIFVIPERKDN